MSSQIPIRNINIIILYAFNKIKSRNINDALNYESDYTASDLILHLFLLEVEKIVKLGTYKNYNNVNEESIFIKGKLDVSKSLRRHSIKKHITYDEFNSNNKLNAIINITLRNILYSRADNKFKKRARLIYPYFLVDTNILLSDSFYKKIILNKANNYYEFAIKLSVMINKKIIPSDNKGKFSFYEISDDDDTMSAIYEEFIRNFYKLHTNYTVSSKHYKWFLLPLLESSSKFLPRMETDIELVDKVSDTKIIIDAKYYKRALNSRYNQEKHSSSNMYQMNTYLLHNMEYNNLRGILLYPSVGYSFNNIYLREDQYTLEFHTIDLDQEWLNIENDLLDIIKPVKNTNLNKSDIYYWFRKKYVIKTLSRIKSKYTKYFVINAILNKVGNINLKPLTKQYTYNSKEKNYYSALWKRLLCKNGQ